MQTLQNYKIFLDDERMPSAKDADAVIVRSFWEFKKVVVEKGVPSFITFDHDLGDEPYNGKKCAEFLTMEMELNDVDVSGFTYDVHSQNPVGAAAIRGWLDPWLIELASR